MRRLPDTELELMKIIWNYNNPMTRSELAQRMNQTGTISPSAVLSLLSRLQIRNFITIEKREGINYYSPLVSQDFYIRETEKNIIDYMFEGSISNFIAALHRGHEMNDDDLNELKQFIDSKTAKLELSN